MEFISNWTNCILITIVVVGIIEVIVPEGETKKFVFLVLGIMTSIMIATPLIATLSGDVNIDEIFDISAIEESSYYIETLRNTASIQTDVLEEVYADNVVQSFNKYYSDMKLTECKITFFRNAEGKIVDTKYVVVKCDRAVEDIKLLKSRVAGLCEVDAMKVSVR